MAAWFTATPMTGCSVTSGTDCPRKNTRRPSFRLALYCSTLLRPMSRTSHYVTSPRRSERSEGTLDDDLCAGGLSNLVDRHALGELLQLQASRSDGDDGQIGDDHLHDLDAGERQRAALEDFVFTALRRVFHRDDHLPRAGDHVHGPAHALDHHAWNHPVRQIAFFVDLKGAEHRDVDVPAAYHGERLRAVDDR